MIASSVQTIASVSALKVRLLSRARFAHSCTIARATRDGRRRLNRGKQTSQRERERSRGWNKFCLSLSQIFSLLHPKGWGKHRRELSLFQRGRTRSSFRRPCPGGSFATLKWVTRSNRGRWRQRERVGALERELRELRERQGEREREIWPAPQ